jgi:glutaredoxin
MHVVDLDTLPEDDGPLVQMELLTKTGQKTVPNIFIGGQHIGGDSDLSEMYDSGSLLELLQNVDGGVENEMR